MYTIEDIKSNRFVNLLTPEEEKKLIEKIRFSKDNKLINKFIKLHRFLVASIVVYYPTKKILFSQLMQAGNKGLRKALDNYKITSKFRFSVYAVWFIRAELHKLLGLPEYPEKLLKK